MILNTTTTAAAAILNPRPKKRLKMPDLTWNDLPIEIKEHIVLAAPKELRSLFRLVCWEWYTIVNPHVIKFPSKQKWGAYHAKHYQTAGASWALRTENVNLLEWLVLAQGMLPPKDLKIHSAWLELAAVREPRYALVHHLMATWTWKPPYCHKVAMIAMRSGNMRLLKLSLGKEMTLSEFREYISNKKMSHAPFADMDNNDEMIEFCHPVDCVAAFESLSSSIEWDIRMKHKCLRYQIKEIVKVKHFEPFAYVEPILSLEKYRFFKNKYRMVFDFYAQYGSIKGMISVLNKYGRLDELRSILMESTWKAAIKGGDLYILEYMLNAYEITKPTYVETEANKHIRTHDYKVLEWLVDNDIFHPDESHLIYAILELSDDPELMPMLSWLMKKYALNQKVPLESDGINQIFITEAAIKTNRLEVIHWIYKKGLLWTMASNNWVPKNIRNAITQSISNCCYHLLRVLHNLRVCNLSYTLVCSETMELLYYEDARSMEKRPTRWIHYPGMLETTYPTTARDLLQEYDTFNFMSSKLRKN